MRIGIVGVPPKKILKKYQNHIFIDLDTKYETTNNKIAERYIPENYCATIKSIIANAISLKLDLIIFDTGYSKCDNARFVACILKKIIKTRIITTQNNDRKIYPQIICESDLPLEQKFDLIVRSVTEKIDKSGLNYVKPKFGFWGVPPNDFSILSLFPKETHIFGWTRCMEAKTPASLELEMYVKKDLPTIFFAQTFCSKNVLAKYLSTVHNGLYVEVADKLTSSVINKIEAFIQLNKAN